ncbi:NUDIX domain-containing protein [Thauera sp.]|uniref:NUDIX domain-containing protein n=1 Tax=Thauera sp. TaxID=1905334 RepID=UPI0039E5C1F7
MKPTKSCPVLLRRDGEVGILAFQHPIAGFQIVKGSIEEGESPEEAAIRELAEESGVQSGMRFSRRH